MPIQIQDRDLHLFQELADCGFLTLAQIAELCFEGNRETAKKRLQKLQKSHAIIRSKPPRGILSFFQLSNRIWKVITKQRDASRHQGHFLPPRIPGNAIQDHECAVRDFWVKVKTQGTDGGRVKMISIASRELQFTINGRVTRPDGYLEIENANGTISRFFVEVDNGTETLSRVGDKVAAYLEFYRTGRFVERCGGRREEFKNHPLRVILLLPSVHRMQSASHLVYRGASGDFVWLNIMKR